MIFTQIFIAVAVSLFAATAQNPVESPIASGKENYEGLQAALHASIGDPAVQNVNVREVGEKDYDDHYDDDDADISKRDNEKQLENSKVAKDAEKNLAGTELERGRRTGETASETGASENQSDAKKPITDADILAELDKMLNEKRSIDDGDDGDDDDDDDDDDSVSRQKRDVDDDDDDDDDEDDLSIYKRETDDMDDDDDDDDDDDQINDDEYEDVTRRKRELYDEEDDDDDDDDDDDVNRIRRQEDDDDDDSDSDDDDGEEDIDKRDVNKEERKADSPSDKLSHLVGDPTHLAVPSENNSAAPVVPPAPQPRPARNLEEDIAKDTAQLEDKGEDGTTNDDGKINDEGTDLTKKSLNTIKKFQVPNLIAKHLNPFERAMLPVALWKKSSGQRLLPLDKMLLQKYEKFKGPSVVQFPPSPGVGPIAEKYKLQMKFGGGFTKNPKVDVPWHEPQMMSNCWVQSMLAGRYGFSPNCNEDGTFGPKQCFLQRCWCVNKDGSPQERDDGGRFHYTINGVILKCTQHYR